MAREAFGEIFGGDKMDDHRARMRTRRESLACEELEGRVVLSGWGGGGNLLAQSLNSIGVVTGPVGNAEGGIIGRFGPSSSQSSLFTQLETDKEALQTELGSLAAKSGVTVADITTLQTDSQAILSAGLTVNAPLLQTAVGELANALTGSTTVTQARAQTDFNAAFSGTNYSASPPPAAVTNAFHDVSTAITHSNVTTGDLSTVATDQTNIQTDLTNIQKARGTSTGSTGSTDSTGGLSGGHYGHRFFGGGGRR